MPVAIITGASRGLGQALAAGLAGEGWDLVLDARGATALAEAAAALPKSVTIVPGDITDPGHRADLIAAADALGGVDLLINNAGGLGPSPLPKLAEYPLDALREVFEVNVVALLALTQLALPGLRERAGALVNLTSDAAVEPYEGWGGYGSSKAAVEQLSNVLAAEEPGVRVWWTDPGDLRTQMHQDAFPGEDISDRPLPATVVPAMLKLLADRPESGRYRLTEPA
ncbi:Short-chain dehydrogenase [Actinokineospora alba]|uniref:Short-chain dehydrogenase n=1 Tax=Actinokineospora alba TaxID=504798 RepID=A0A1H0HUQ7_9PSEU|nr:SDR family oxidoreductase [Actinokineospora alba]TDP64737.1 short-subunit dehydrogenase [Actinokineospora alba]SDH44505.1 Short-chain dehydrogenase [Actinokineospora alba]SDO22888.1 Short-chain dehydrogenase [Actinokineospora alba]